MTGFAKIGFGLLATAAVTTGTTLATTKIAESHQYNIVHEITTTDVYTINGVEVDQDFWDEYLAQLNGGVVPDVYVEPVDPVEEPETVELPAFNPGVEETSSVFVPMSDKIVYCDQSNYPLLMLLAGNEFEYLAVYNCGTVVGNHDSTVLGCTSTGKSLANSQDVKEDYFVLSCFSRDMSQDFNSYLVDSLDRTTPGIFNGISTWGEQPEGIYFLKNVRIECIGQSSELFKDAKYLYQIVLSYEVAYTLEEFQALYE